MSHLTLAREDISQERTANGYYFRSILLEIDRPAQHQQARRWIQALILISPGILWTVIFFLIPLGIMAVYSFWGFQGGKVIREVTLENYQAFVERSHFIDALLNSLEVALIVTLISVVLAYPVAYILAYTVPPRWQRLALLMAVLPF